MHRFMSVLTVFFTASSANAQVAPVELTPADVASADTTFFTVSPTVDPSLFLGETASGDVRRVDFNTAPDGPLSEGTTVTDQYASLGVTMNDIRLSADIYGGNNYGSGYATEDNAAQVFTFAVPVVAVGLVNTSPDRDLIQFWSGPNATGVLLFEFRDQQNVSVNFRIDRFVGGVAGDGVTIGSFSVQNATGDLELDELIFVTRTVCLADTNKDGKVTPADFSAWIAAFNAMASECDQNGDSVCTPADFSAWIANYNAGCP